MFQLVGRTALLLSALLAFGQADELATKSQQARQLMASGKFAEAIPIYKDLIHAVPGNAGLLFNLALAQHMSGREREAIPNFEAVLKSQPKLVPALVSLGAARMALHQSRQAIAPLQKAVALEPANQDARGMLASALADAGQPDEAAGQFRKLTEESPDDSRAWFGLGKAYESAAAGAFDRLRKLEPQSPYVAALVADTRVKRRQYTSALFFYREALKQLPNLHGIHGALAEVYRKTGDPDLAAAEEAKERELPAADCPAHPAECQFIAGHDVQALSAAGTSQEALFWQAKAAGELAMQAFFRLGQLPPSVELHQLKAEIARGQNQHAESASEWRAALKISPGNARLQHELAVSLFLAGDYAAALNESKAAPPSPERDFLVGDSLLRLEEPDKAIPYLRAALVEDPGLLAAHASLGLALSRTGKIAEAVPHLEKAQDLDDDGSLHYQLARAYQAAGDSVKAQTAMAQYREIQKRKQARQ